MNNRPTPARGTDRDHAGGVYFCIRATPELLNVQTLIRGLGTHLLSNFGILNRTSFEIRSTFGVVCVKYAAYVFNGAGASVLKVMIVPPTTAVLQSRIE